MTGFSPPDPHQPLEPRPNQTIRNLLTCPRCREHSIHAARSREHPFAFMLKCVANCGEWGVFEPPLTPEVWGSTSLEQAAAIIQDWLDKLQEARARASTQRVSRRVAERARPKVAASPHDRDRDKEIERLRAELARCADTVHRLYHPVGQWSECPVGLCAHVREVLGVS